MADEFEGFPPPSYSFSFVPFVLQAAAASAGKGCSPLQNVSKGKKKHKEHRKKSDIKWTSEDNEDDGLILSDGVSSTNSNLNLMQLLALNALELSIPATDIVLKDRKNNWIQLSGHKGAFCPAGLGTIWKKRSEDDTEVKAYLKLSMDVMAAVIPKFYRDLQYNGENFMEIQDMLAEYENPSVMDIKMGVRTFVESEISNQRLREDLYKKMIGLDPNAPTAEEHETKAVTKLRYMQFRESLSSTSTLGFRIEGFRTKTYKSSDDLKLVKTREQVLSSIVKFLSKNEAARIDLTKKLHHLRSILKMSPFFTSHEIIGSSLLFMYDNYKANVCMIDFAKTFPIPANSSITHSKPWSLGNHEDGYLTGLDNLISIFEEANCDTYVKSDTNIST